MVVLISSNKNVAIAVARHVDFNYLKFVVVGEQFLDFERKKLILNTFFFFAVHSNGTNKNQPNFMYGNTLAAGCRGGNCSIVKEGKLYMMIFYGGS